MASPSPQPPTTALADRGDVHKSCKALESVVNLLNDYCEAASAVVQLQRKLAKAIREAASVKCTNDIATNALNASAIIFDALSDIDAKFAKIADKECETLSGEVKKWFKKLAKEEKAHDERIASSNAKIKQAGQLYERKAKKNAAAAVDEHAKYINLLTALGPEVTQDKYNHQLFITQRHTQTTYGVAVCLAKVADAEWLRSCEGVRRFAPSVGRLGEWRALCEGGWTGPVPRDLPELDPGAGADGRSRTPIGEPPQTASADGSRNASETHEKPGQDASADGQGQERAPPRYAASAASDVEREREREPQGESNRSSASHHDEASKPPTPSLPDASRPQSIKNQQSSTSLASLASFPSPPNHFPLPPIASSPGAQRSPLGLKSDSANGGPSVSFAALPRLTESPGLETMEDEPALAESVDTHKTEETDRAVSPNRAIDASPDTRQDPRDARGSDSLARPGPGPGPAAADSARSSPQSERAKLYRTPSVQHETDSPTTPPVRQSPSAFDRGAYRRGDYLDGNQNEFGVRTGPESPGKARTMNAARPAEIDRQDTGSSTVAELRGRYSRTAASSPPPVRDMPNLTTSVSALASRYNPVEDEMGSPAQRTSSPPIASPRPRPRMSDGWPSSDRSIQSVPMPMPPMNSAGAPDDLTRRRQRVEELEELELRERALELREREREIESQARELERERVRLISSRGGVMDGGGGYALGPGPGPGDVHAPRMRTASTVQRPPPDMAPPIAARPMSQYSYSTTHLVPPGGGTRQRATSHSRESSPVAERSGTADHAPYCGCHACSIDKYRQRQQQQQQPPSPRDLRPVESPPQTREKPRGWIRRLSMPVGFSSDGKKTPSTSPVMNLAGAASSRNSLAMDNRRSYDISNHSVTSLAGRR